MLHVGDIVSLSEKNEEKNTNAMSILMVIGRNVSSDNLTAVNMTTEVSRYSPDAFTEFVTSMDLDEGSLEDDYIVLIDSITTIRPEMYRKVARLKKEKLDRVLRTFSHYAAYSHYSISPEDRKSRSYISPSGKVLDEKELFGMIDASLDMWLTAGRFHDDFECKLAEFLGVKHVLAVNSGSSANLLALSALTSHKLGKRRLTEGDEVITVAAAFPTTVAPIIQNGLIPVFVDVEPGTYNIDPLQIENAVSEKTKAIFLAHTLGNPFNLDKVLEVREKHDLFLIEDNCDALGSKYKLKSNGNTSISGYTGTFGDIATFSFYPAHHITMGEGGAVATNDPRLKNIMLSIRDWGRDCWCPTGHDNTCGQRFSQQHGQLPAGFDHKYVYSHLGYNLKITDWQAAIGIVQLQKLPVFIEKRKENFKLLHDGLKPFEEHLILPRSAGDSDAAWFGFPITLKENSRFNKKDLVRFLEEQKIGTRELFAGNILRQPAFLNSKIKMRIGHSGMLQSNNLSGKDYNMVPNTDIIMDRTFWIGVWPGLNRDSIEYVIQKFGEFFNMQEQ